MGFLPKSKWRWHLKTAVAAPLTEVCSANDGTIRGSIFRR